MDTGADVSVEKIWDGRGDALGDARLTTCDGRMADDLRLKASHFRVMAHVGRQNHRRGWLRVSQTELAERWNCHRNAINRAFVDLVAWGYLLQRTQEEAGESFCQYKVALDGEADTGGAQSGVHPGPEGGAHSSVHTCTPGEYTRAHSQCAPPLYTKNRHTPTHAEDSPPAPPGGGRESRRRSREARRERWAEAVLAELTPSPVVDRLLRPLADLVGPPAKGDGATVLRELHARLATADASALERACARLKGVHRYRFPPFADVVAAVGAAAQLSAKRVVVLPGSPAWKAWADHYRRLGLEPEWVARRCAFEAATLWPGQGDAA